MKWVRIAVAALTVFIVVLQVNDLKNNLNAYKNNLGVATQNISQTTKGFSLYSDKAQVQAKRENQPTIEYEKALFEGKVLVDIATILAAVGSGIVALRALPSTD